MNKKNIGVLTMSSILIASAIAGGVSTIVLAEDRSNAYAPTKLQKERLSLLESFINDDHFSEKGVTGINKGNPFAMLAKAKISRIIEEVLLEDGKADGIFAKYESYNKEKNVNDINIIHKISFLRLDKNHDSIIVVLKNHDGTWYKDAFIKINLEINYDEEKLSKWGRELLPKIVAKSSQNKKIYPIDFNEISKMASTLDSSIVNKDKDDFLNSLSAITSPDPTAGRIKQRELFSQSLIDSLILWRIYDCSPSEMASIKDTDGLRKFITKNANNEATQEAITKSFEPYESVLKYFPTAIDAHTADIITPNMDILDTIDVSNEQANFDGFEMSSLMGLILFPDAYISNKSLEVNSLDHRNYNPLSNVRDTTEFGYESRPPFLEAIDNYKYFPEGDE